MQGEGGQRSFNKSSQQEGLLAGHPGVPMARVSLKLCSTYVCMYVCSTAHTHVTKTRTKWNPLEAIHGFRAPPLAALPFAIVSVVLVIESVRNSFFCVHDHCCFSLVGRH